MTKIDPAPLIAEAQARETALKVALDKIERAERLVVFWFLMSLMLGCVLLSWVLA